MKSYAGKTDSNGRYFPFLNLLQLEDSDGGVITGREVAIDAGGENPSWLVFLDELETAYRCPTGLRKRIGSDLIWVMNNQPALAVIEGTYEGYRLAMRLETALAAERNNVPFYSMDAMYTTKEMWRFGREQRAAALTEAEAKMWEPGARKSSTKPGWTNPEAAHSIAKYALSRRVPGNDGQLWPRISSEKLQRDYTEEDERRMMVQMELIDLRRTDYEYAGHNQRVAELRGTFLKHSEVEGQLLSNQMLLATIYTLAKHAASRDELRDRWMPHVNRYRKDRDPRALGIVASNFLYHAKDIRWKTLRHMAEATYAVLRDSSREVRSPQREVPNPLD